MLISKRYAKKLIKEGKAQVDGRTTDQARWEDRDYGRTFVIVRRFDLQRIDHYEDKKQY